METGIYDIENNKYRAILDHISISELNVFGKAASVYQHEYLNGNRRPASKSQEIGTWLHTYTLEPNVWAKTVRVGGNFDRRTTIGKAHAAAEEAEAQSLGIQFITQAIYDKIRFAGDALLRHPLVKEYSKSWVTESALFWIDPDTGAKCKGKIDSHVVTNNCTAIMDVKTTQDALGFPYTITGYGYHRQAVYYMDGLSHASKGEIVPTQFYWLCVEMEAPYLSKVYVANQEMLDFGRNQYKVLLQRFEAAKKANVWPGLSEDVEVVSLPIKYMQQPQELFKRGEEF